MRRHAALPISCRTAETRRYGQRISTNTHPLRPNVGRGRPISDDHDSASYYQQLKSSFQASLSADYGERENPPDYETLSYIVGVLERARVEGRCDVLAHIAASEERWPVMDWIMKALLGNCKGYDATKEDSQISPHWVSNRESGKQALDEYLQCAVSFALPGPLHLDTHKRVAMLGSEHTSSLNKCALSQLWQSLGKMVIDGIDMFEDRKAHQTIMTCFVDILAQLHHHNLVPANIYNYDPPYDATVILRPPLLYCLSSRIMTQLTNISWNKFWIAEMKEAEKDGALLPPPRVQPRFDPVSAEVWLECILWICVEGGWISEAAWIISQLEHTPSSNAKPWRVATWEEICVNEAPKMTWTRAFQAQMEAAGLGVVAGNFSDIKMRPRSISLEVVSAVMDGLANNSFSTIDPGQYLGGEFVGTIRDCQRLLERSGHSLFAERTHALALRMLESSFQDSKSSARDIENIISLSPVVQNAQEPSESQHSSLEESDSDQSASMLGLLHRNLEGYAVASDEAGVKRTLEKISNIIDANRNLYIRQFASELRQRSKERPEDISPQSNKASPILHPQIPLHVLDGLLEFVTSNKLTEIGAFLFHNEEIDGGFIQSSVFAEARLQPRLIQYAIANADDNVLARVIERIQPPIPPKTLHALIRYRIVNHQWQAVEDVLRQLSSSRDATWTAGDCMTMAAYMIYHSKRRDSQEVRNAEHAQRVLNDILRGSYDPPQDPSQQVSLFKVQLANQIKSILRSVPDDSFAFLSTSAGREAGQLSNSRKIAAVEFSYLLEAVTGRFGCSAGRALFEKWCMAPDVFNMQGRDHGQHTGTASEKVVEPSLFLVRTITRPIIDTLSGKPTRSSWKATLTTSRTNENPAARVGALPQEDLSTLRWATDMYRRLGAEDSVLTRDFLSLHESLG